MKNKGFTLIELLVVIAIIGVLSTMAIIALGNARAKSRDAKRVADIKQISTALELYYSDYNTYPTTITPGNSLVSPDGTRTYMGKIPNNPTPMNDGDCPNKDYSYGYVTSTNKYALGFCLGSSVSSLTAGVQTASTDTGLGNAGLVGWWKFDEGSGLTAIDSSGSNNATLIGGPTRQSGNICKIGSCLSFDGLDDWVSPPSQTYFAQSYSSFTITLWVNPSVVGGTIIHNAGESNGWFTGLLGYRGGKLTAFTYSGASWTQSIVTSVPGQWKFVSMVRNSQNNSTAIYEDGVLVGFGIGSYDPNGITHRFGIGRYIVDCCRMDAPGWFNGYMDDVRFYNRSLSDAEILVLYNATK
ncbi:MAG: prepilin-type N-terminal cleavage/methylation domain-containing protein [Candidatus Falkowbacteria bacterium]|nr:prepilin-type N-terminal cleavage/methylation domain-containing protein [Candidatus Falkowbacteria bacterium]